MKTTVAAIVALLVGGLAGCSNEEWNERGMYGDEVPQSRGGMRDDSTRLQSDPVCGRTVNPLSSISDTYDDEAFYFHDQECAERFKENPHAYLPGGDDRDTLARMEKDPVCGKQVDPKTAIRGTYNHDHYYFDSEECAGKFKDNPHAYMPGGDDRPKEVR